MVGGHESVSSGHAASLADFPRATGKLETMIVLLRGKAGAIRSREISSRAAQAPLVALLHESGARIVATTSVIDAVIADMTAAQARALASDPAVEHVYPNTTIPGPTPAMEAGTHSSSASALVTPKASPGPCGTKAKPELDPEALGNINYAGAASRGIDGAGVTVAFMAGGISPTLKDFQRNKAYASAGAPAGKPVITRYVDFGGDGTNAPSGDAAAESFGDASSIVAQANETYNIAQYVNTAHPLPATCDIKILGAAPGANLYALDIFNTNPQNLTTSSGFIQAINYAATHGVKVLNESFGGNPFPDLSNDLTRLANDAAVAAGVTVVASSGDAGNTSTQGSPSTDPNVISAGASTTFRAYSQVSFGGINWPGWKGGYIDNNLSSLSSAGFNQTGGTVDLVAPGDLNWALCSTNTTLFPPPDCIDYAGAPSGLQLFGGTSESAPLISAAAADVIQAYTKTHGGKDPSPALVKQILMSSATDIDAPAVEQGAGLLNIGAAVKLAESIPGTKAKPAGGTLVGPNQINVVASPGASTGHTIIVTNTGSSTEKVALSTRQLTKEIGTGAAGTFCMNPTGVAITGPPACHANTGTFRIWSGVSEVYQAVPFTVAAGASRLEFAASYPIDDPVQSSLLHFGLFTPAGAFAAYSLPQGAGGYGEVEVAHPPAGTWTAVFFTGLNDLSVTPPVVGTSGTVDWSASTWAYAAGSAISPASLSIPAGKSAKATLKVTNPSAAGDTDESVVVNSPSGTTTIPVTIRTLVGLTPSGGSFTGTLTGGNGRSGAPAQENVLSFVVPKGEPNLNVNINLASITAGPLFAGTEFEAYLDDPTGQAVGYTTNYTENASSAPEAVTEVSLYHARPLAGTWSVVLQWANPVIGGALSVGFSGTVGFSAFHLSSSTVPNSASATIAEGAATPFAVNFCNPSSAPQEFFVDPREPVTTEYALGNIFALSEAQLLGSVTVPGADLAYLVPPDTTELQANITGSLPVTFDMSYLPGDPDVTPAENAPGVSGSESAGGAGLTFTNPEVSPGVWGLVPAEIGPFPASGQGSGVAQVNASVVTKAFDPTVTSSTGDLWQEGTLLIGAPADTPLYLAPSGCGTITVTITPTAAVGSTVSGTLHLDDQVIGAGLPSTFPVAAQILPMGDQVLAIPYKYTVAS